MKEPLLFTLASLRALGNVPFSSCRLHFEIDARYKGRLVHFYKRAQILVADLWAAFGCQTAVNGHFASFADVGRLTMFADYRVPQILRHVGVRVPRVCLTSG